MRPSPRRGKPSILSPRACTRLQVNSSGPCAAGRDNRGVGVAHYENFPVASVLCPPRIRGAVVAVYHYARTADDLADEGDASTEQRQAELLAYRDDLRRVFAGQPPSPRWEHVFAPLRQAIAGHAIPPQPLEDLLDAFLQDVRNPRHADRSALLDYCRRSANPVGRLLLHLHGVSDAGALARADRICTALQLANFWQDCSVDLPRGRVYLPMADAQRHGVDLDDPPRLRDGPSTQALLRELCDWTRKTMLDGADLALQLPGRAGWELRLVVQGGLRILDKIRQVDYRTLAHRPVIGARDAVPLAWRALTMRPQAASARSSA